MIKYKQYSIIYPIFAIVGLLISHSTLSGQNKGITDSLIVLLNNSNVDTTKIALLLAIGDEYESKQPSKAVYFYNEALKISEKAGLSDHKANCMEYLGIVYQDGLAKFDSALFFKTESMKIRKATVGENHPAYASSINNLGLLLFTMGNTQEAEKLFKDAIKIQKLTIGENHKSYAGTLNNLAFLYNSTGNYSSAEPLYLEAIKVRKAVYGDKHPQYASSLNNLALLYKTMGNYAAAEPLYKEAIEINKATIGEKHHEYAVGLNNLASLHVSNGNYDAAEALYKNAARIHKEALSEKHPKYATYILNLAAVYFYTNKLAEAESAYIEALKIRKEVLGEKHLEYAQALNNLAFFYYNTGKYEDAESLYMTSIKIKKDAMGEKNPDFAITLNNLARLYKTTGKYELAEPIFLNSLEIANNSITRNFSFLSDAEKEKYYRTQSGKISVFYSFALKRKENNPSITETVYNNVIKNKGLLLKSATAMRNAINKTSDTALISKYKEWVEMKKEISKLLLTEISKRKKDPESLEAQANAIEKELVKKSFEFGNFEKAQQTTWKEIKNKLKANEVAIEFIRFKDNSNDRRGNENNDTIAYCALIIKKDSNYPEMVFLFRENDLSNIIGNKISNNASYINNLYGLNTDINDKLYNIIWKPMEAHLKDINTIYFSPDGLLHKISFSAIGKSNNIFLSDIYNLVRLSSTSILAYPEKKWYDKNLSASICGGIDYSCDSCNVSIWNYLAGTKSESEQIFNIFNEKKLSVLLHSEKNATEQNIKEIAGKNSILHIATHGFFYPEPESVKDLEKETESFNLLSARGKKNGFGLWQYKKNTNPLMRSGIVLAGANQVWNRQYAGEGDDGVLTALEVSQLDLSKTQLIALSACETGLGDIKGSEGVYGLQRAFKMAGAKFLIMSLWQVPDKETSEFMIRFYDKLLDKKDIRKSFNETQAFMRKIYNPFYWGAFVLIE